jgi:hypothetical protein
MEDEAHIYWCEENYKRCTEGSRRSNGETICGHVTCQYIQSSPVVSHVFFLITSIYYPLLPCYHMSHLHTSLTIRFLTVFCVCLYTLAQSLHSLYSLSLITCISQSTLYCLCTTVLYSYHMLFIVPAYIVSNHTPSLIIVHNNNNLLWYNNSSASVIRGQTQRISAPVDTEMVGRARNLATTI